MQPWCEIQIFGNEVWRWVGPGGSVMVMLFAAIVEGVGFRSTRLRTEDGDIVAIPCNQHRTPE